MKTTFRLTLFGLAALSVCHGQGGAITVAGNGNSGATGDGGPATSASLSDPSGLAVDSAGNIYIADVGNYRVRKVNAGGTISTYAGNGTPGTTGDGGLAVNAELYNLLSTSVIIQGMAVDTSGNLYIPDSKNNRVRKVTPAGIISTFAGSAQSSILGDGGLATSAGLPGPTGVAVDSAGNVYIATATRIRKVNTSGVISTVAGNGTPSYTGDGGPATSAAMEPLSVAVDSSGNLYILDSVNTVIRKVTGGNITTIAGTKTNGLPSSGDGGLATKAILGDPVGMAVDNTGNIYVIDAPALRKIDTSGIITTVASPSGNAAVTVDPAGNVYLSNHTYVYKLAAAPAPAPVITAVENGASFLPGIVPNSWVTILGTNLSPTTDNWSSSIVGGKLPTVLDGVSVSMGGKPAYMYYILPGQINVLAPDISPGPVSVTVTTPSGTSAAVTATVSLYGPAFFLWPGSQVVATRTDYSYAVAAGTFAGVTTVPAKPGDVLILWATGFGPTSPLAPDGVVVPSTSTYSTSAAPLVTIDNIPATFYGAALASGSVGLYQIAIQVPSTLANGTWPVQAQIGGVSSPSGTLLTVHN